MNVFRLVGFALVLSGAAGAVYGQAQSASALAADGWRPIVPSHDKDFTIHCFKGKDLVWGIYPRGNTSAWSVARDIWVKSAADGRVTAIGFQRGFVRADTPDVYFPANDVSCEITEQ